MQIFGSLERLVLDIVGFGIVATLIWRFPEPSLKSALVAGEFLPSLASCALFTRLCKHHTRALLLTAGGALIGFLLAPVVYISVEGWTWYDHYAYEYLFWPVYSGVGALVAGLTVYAVEVVTSRLTSRSRRGDSPPDSEGLKEPTRRG
jgi:hypothetical protein